MESEGKAPAGLSPDGFAPDGALYERLRQPFNGPEEANKALQAFIAGVRKLREEHKIPDVLLTVSCSVRYPDGAIGEAQGSSMHGDFLREPLLAAFAYGQAVKGQRALLNKLAAGAKPAVEALE